VYAGSDFFFVPSRFEPCGLTQMYAMRYGSLPIVTDVGGLHDTVEPLDVATDRGVGLVARSPDVGALRDATRAAFDLFENPERLARARARAMAKDFSWDGPASEYEALYRDVIDARA
jgi:starch synthase